MSVVWSQSYHFRLEKAVAFENPSARSGPSHVEQNIDGAIISLKFARLRQNWGSDLQYDARQNMVMSF